MKIGLSIDEETDNKGSAKIFDANIVDVFCILLHPQALQNILRASNVYMGLRWNFIFGQFLSFQQGFYMLELKMDKLTYIYWNAWKGQYKPKSYNVFLEIANTENGQKYLF